MISSRLLALVLASALGALSCVTRGTYDEVVSERDVLSKERSALREKVTRLEASATSLQGEREELLESVEDLRIARHDLEARLRKLQRAEAELSTNLEDSRARLAERKRLLAEREAEIQRMRSTYDGLVADLEDEVAAGQIQIARLRSGLSLNLTQDILFPSGSAALNAQGAAVLKKVAKRLAELPHVIEVQGHTDDVPIGTAYPSNWELAAARASSVVRLLAAEGVDPTRMVAASRGEYHPVASNDTAEGRSRNRRIEIRLEPREESEAAEGVAANPPGQPVSKGPARGAVAGTSAPPEASRASVPAAPAPDVEPTQPLEAADPITPAEVAPGP